MKRFKKRHTRLPKAGTVERLMSRMGPDLHRKYHMMLRHCPSIFPQEMRETTLPRFDPNKRANICYYPDLHNFTLYELPNRSLPADKYLNLFRGMIESRILDQLAQDLTNYRLEFFTEEQDWLDVYRMTEVESCMSNTTVVGLYAHPENKLALAALFAPDGATLVGRTVVNTEEKWYVRLFGDRLLVDKLTEQGYRKLNEPPKRFKMYGHIEPPLRPELIRVPYFDFTFVGREVLPDTYDPVTGKVELIINPGIH